MSLQEVIDRVPAVAAMVDEMNEIIPGVPATEKNLKSLLEELVDRCESEPCDPTYMVRSANAMPMCEFTIYSHRDPDDTSSAPQLVVYLRDVRAYITHKGFPVTPDGLLKGIVWAKKSLKRYREEGPCTDCGPPYKKLKLEGFPKCFDCTIKKAVDLE